MRTQWTFGDSVRVTRNIRNDGTYSGAQTGELLLRRGSVGAVVDIGTFLQDEIIYSVHFIEFDRVVGCREEELIGSDEPWLPSRFEARQKVAAAKVLTLAGAVHSARIEPGARGEVLRVLPDATGTAVIYHVHFDALPGRTLAVPETALIAANEVEAGHD